MTSACEMEKILIREASARDIGILATYHRMLFEEMWTLKGELLDAALGQEVETAYARKLERELESEICKAWVVEESGRIVAGGAVTIGNSVPTPFDPSCRVAYLHSIYTEKSCRNRHYAQGIVDRAITYARTLGLKRVLLNASDAGRPVYEKMGFLAVPDAMRLVIE